MHPVPNPTEKKKEGENDHSASTVGVLIGMRNYEPKWECDAPRLGPAPHTACQYEKLGALPPLHHQRARHTRTSSKTPVSMMAQFSLVSIVCILSSISRSCDSKGSTAAATAAVAAATAGSETGRARCPGKVRVPEYRRVESDVNEAGEPRASMPGLEVGPGPGETGAGLPVEEGDVDWGGTWADSVGRPVCTVRPLAILVRREV